MASGNQAKDDFSGDSTEWHHLLHSICESHLDGPSVASACCVSTFWRSVCSSSHVWEGLCKARWGVTSTVARTGQLLGAKDLYSRLASGLTEKWCGSSYDPMTDIQQPYDCYMMPQEVSPLFERRKHLIDPMCDLMRGEMLEHVPRSVVENTGPNCSQHKCIDVQYQCVWPTLDGSESIIRGVIGARDEYFAFAEYELMHGNVHVPTYYCGTFIGRHLIGFFTIGRQEMGDQWFINVLHQERAPLGFFTLIMSEIIDIDSSHIPLNSPSFKGSGMLNYHKPNTSGAKHAYQILSDVIVTVKEADIVQQRFRLCVQWRSLAWSFSADMEKQPEKQGWYVGHVELQPPEAFHLHRKVVLTLWCLFSGLAADQGVVLFKAVGPTVIQPPNVVEIVPTMCMYGVFAFKT